MVRILWTIIENLEAFVCLLNFFAKSYRKTDLETLVDFLILIERFFYNIIQLPSRWLLVKISHFHDFHMK